jgi:hypothetical protein
MNSSERLLIDRIPHYSNVAYRTKLYPQPMWLSALRMLTRWVKRLFGYLRIRTCKFMLSVYACNRV